MKPSRFWRAPLVIVAALLVFALVSITSGWLGTSSFTAPANSASFSLVRPPFLARAQAAPDLDIGALLDQEAGISAWLYTALPIDLGNAASAFRVIEDQTASYIIGSVDLPNYSEHYDTHVYVHTDGWILAYYLRPDPASKIIAIKEESITTTNLASIVAIVAGAAGVPSTGINYYDFRYPNAKNILMVYEDYSDGDDFTINLPSSFAYYERGWAIIDNVCCDHYFMLDTIRLTHVYAADAAYYGTISAAQLAPDVVHAIRTRGAGVLMVIYTEP